MQKLHFTKMHGLGNDYLYVYGEVPDNITSLSEKLSDRHFGAGSDGMIYICKSDCADFKMRIFNADGSEAKMCGNGIRCVAKYVFDKGYTDKTSLSIETLSGIKKIQLQVQGGKAKYATVDMGITEIQKEKELSLDKKKIVCLPVSVGNPHAVIFTDDIAAVPLTEAGPLIEKHSDFPGGVNVEFVQILTSDKIRMRVWERGSGVTLACGTGACASVAASVSRGFCPEGKEVTVILDGGELKISVDKDGRALMTGPAEIVYEGEVEI